MATTKFLFLDYRQFETVDGFRRALEPPRVPSSPLFTSDKPWERNYIGLYGSVARRQDGLFQLWYTCGGWGTAGNRLAYAESPDGVEWQRPPLGLFEAEGTATNILMDVAVIGACVLCEPADPREDWRYKLLCAPEPCRRISAFRSPDGIHWKPAAENPVIGTNPDGPMCLMRDREGRYVAYHRPCWGDRRVARSESWDFVHWSEAKVVVEPDQSDGTNVQFYGMGSTPYGEYELGTLWVYRTDPEDRVWSKGLGVLVPELVHGRGGYAWHRTAQGEPWIALNRDPDGYGHGQIHIASQPLLLEDEIRYFFSGSVTRHGEDAMTVQGRPNWGVSYASMQPDRFVSVTADSTGRILTRPFWVEHVEVYLNARAGEGGSVRVEILDREGEPIEGWTIDRSVPVTGDSWMMPITWRDSPDPAPLANREIRLRLEVENATLYAVAVGSRDEVRRYRDFKLPYFLPRARELYEQPRL